jgi:DNA processing protein
MSCLDEKNLSGGISRDELLRFHLAAVPGMGPVSLRKLEAHLGTPARILSSSEIELRKIVKKDLAANIALAGRDTSGSQEILEVLDSCNARILYPDSPGVPSRLLRQTGEWHFLIHLGNPCLWDPPPVIGMVGRRQASGEGIELAQELACEFARRGVVTISGMAQGIDRASHFGSLTANGDTVAVLPMGLLQFMRETHHWTPVRDAMEAGRLLLVSGAPPFQAWSVSEAMRRNQWIASWCDALIVVEAGDKGGTWKTASCAARCGRPLWVVNGFKTPEAGLGNGGLASNFHARRLDLSQPVSSLVDLVLQSCQDRGKVHSGMENPHPTIC